ncbi:hypothetical protein AXF42_Ash013466 [Apostasia shenzhenica]|uniref:Uncharacterized protein n=1 Tax=Apostasia shenzhenica TaxID=1088818 RepID=A0A2I0A4A8_9ASPA|nr:hypothetical protein AXF42_Ash013466 [Apostasia shenzhenica]
MSCIIGAINTMRFLFLGSWRCRRSLAGRTVIKVLVGKEMKTQSMLKVNASYLHHPLFKELLGLSGDEFGYSYDGAVRIACDISFFLHLVHLLDTGSATVQHMDLRRLMDSFRFDQASGRPASS